MARFYGVELLLQFVGREPEANVASGLVVGDHAVVDEACDADGSLGVVDLSAGEFQLYHDGGWEPAVRAGTGLFPFFAFLVQSLTNCIALRALLAAERLP